MPIRVTSLHGGVKRQTPCSNHWVMFILPRVPSSVCPQNSRVVSAEASCKSSTLNARCVLESFDDTRLQQHVSPSEKKNREQSSPTSKTCDVFDSQGSMRSSKKKTKDS